MAAFLASGKTREMVFSRADYCCTACFQFLLGRCALSLILAGSLAMLMVVTWRHGSICRCNSWYGQGLFFSCDVLRPVAERRHTLLGRELSLERYLVFNLQNLPKLRRIQDTVLLFGIASASSLVLQVDAACGLRSVMISVADAVSLLTHTHISLDVFDSICRLRECEGVA